MSQSFPIAIKKGFWSQWGLSTDSVENLAAGVSGRPACLKLASPVLHRNSLSSLHFSRAPYSEDNFILKFREKWG